MACVEGGLKMGDAVKAAANFCCFVDIRLAARERMFICIYTKVSVLKVRMNVEIKHSATTIKVKDT